MKTKFIFLFFIITSTCRFYSQVPVLNSSPLVTDKVIFLDFDGHVTSGTGWNSGNLINALPSTMSAANIVVIWKRVREDFRPFNVNVTTDSVRFNNATANKRIRIVVTPTSAWYGTAGGVAYVGSFAWGGNPGTPAWVFENQLGYSAKNIAEAASHETGHSLTLRHQSIYSPTTCSKTAEYSPGVGTGAVSWAPIMGVGYSKNVTIWHLGTNATSCTTIQSDHGSAVPGITSNGFLNFVADDVGNTYATAKTLNLDNLNTLDSGLISQPSDIDVFKFTLCNNRYVSFNIKPWALDTNVNSYQGANLDIRFALYNSANNMLAIDTPLTKLNTLVGINLTPGSYYFTIDGGRSNNYTDYGSLGQYHMRINATNPPAISNTIIVSPNICVGQSTTFSCQSIGSPGNWSWTIDGNSATAGLNTQSPAYTFTAPGIYSVSLVAFTPQLTSCVTTVTLNVGTLPALSITNPNMLLCYPNPNNHSIVLTAAGATDYNWFPGNSTGVGLVASPSVTTTYTLVGANGTCTNSAVSTVTVATNYSITAVASASFICFGNTSTITVNGATNYTLTPGGVGTAPAVVSPTANTTFMVTGATGYCRDTKAVPIIVDPNFRADVVPSVDSICPGESVYISGISTTNFTVNPGGIPGNPATIAPLVTTIYTITATTNIARCFKDTVITIVAKDCFGLGLPTYSSSNGVMIYPNPTSTYFVIECEKAYDSVEVINALGGLVYSHDLHSVERISIETAKWARGIYFVKMQNSSQRSLVKKIIVE